MSKRTVLLTGATGFIALHTLNLLLKRGYGVVGTVRSKEKADKLTANFKKLYPDADLTFEIVKDIAADGAFDEALKAHPEVTAVLHTASPVELSGGNKDYREGYWKPAVIGTKNILNAIKTYAPQVTTYVQTSSFSALINVDKAGDPSFIHTEETWNPITWDEAEIESDAYNASKKLSEEFARNFVDEEKPNFTITTVDPPYVFGPQVFEESIANPRLNLSAEIVHELLKTPVDNTEYNDKKSGLAIDVRDVALLHVLPLEKENLAGKRLFPVAAPYTTQTLLNLIHKLFPELDGKVGKGKPEGAEERIDETKTFYDDSKTIEWTGVTFIPLETTIRDAVSQILEYKKSHTG